MSESSPTEDQSEQALARMDAALARIEAVLTDEARAAAASREAASAAALAQLRQRHSALRIATSGALAQIDALIGTCDAGSASGSASGSRPA